MRLGMVVVLLSISMTGQTAKVVPVDMASASKLAMLAKQVKDAQTAYESAVKEVQQKLLTTLDYRNSGQCFAFREGNEDGSGGSGLVSGDTFSVLSSYEQRCESAEERAKRIKMEDEEHAQQTHWKEEHPEHYWLADFCNGGEFTDDFHYIVPKAKTEYPEKTWPGLAFTPAWQSSVVPLTH